MTPTQIEQLRFALSQPRQENWPGPPIVPGNWRDLTDVLALNTVISIADWLEEEGDIRNIALDWSIDRVRVRPLLCYQDTVLVELGGHAGFGRPGLINVIVQEETMVLLNGSSAHLHDLNYTVPPYLETDRARLDYMQLFMNWVHGDRGRFQPVGTEDELRARLLPEAAGRELGLNLSPLTEAEVPGGSPAIARFTGTVLYGADLFGVVMELRSNGLVEMVDDVEVKSGTMGQLPVREESLAGPMLYSRV